MRSYTETAPAALSAGPLAGGAASRWVRLPSGRSVAIGYGLVVVLSISLAAAAAELGWLPHDPDAMDLGTMLAPPSLAHPLGTDFIGRDVLSRIMLGTHAFLGPGFLAVGISLVLGVLLGVLAGYWPERFATPIGFCLELVDALPKLVLVLLVIALFKPDVYAILAVVGITNVPATAELLRARIAVLRRKSYIEAATALGLHPLAVIGKHVLWHHGRALIAVQATLGMADVILIETSLSYLGFGVQEPTPSWGNMVALGKDYFFRGELWISTVPALAILLTILGLHLLGDALLAGRDTRQEVH
jgi:peptide/nickel transport system permease protein